MSEARLRPRPTSTRVPTRERTIWWQKALASISKASRCPRPDQGLVDRTGRGRPASSRHLIRPSTVQRRR